MQYSFHVPLWFGLLKIKSRSRLRNDERERKVPIWQIGDTFIVWSPRQIKKAPGDTLTKRYVTAEILTPEPLKSAMDSEKPPISVDRLDASIDE